MAPLTAMPTLACFSAGASLTPSPVMPTMWPPACRALTMANLCSGNTWAKPSPAAMAAAGSAGAPCRRPCRLPRCSGELVRRRSAGQWGPVTILMASPMSSVAAMVAALSFAADRSGKRKGTAVPFSSVRATPRVRNPLPASAPPPPYGALCFSTGRQGRRSLAAILGDAEAVCHVLDLGFGALADRVKGWNDRVM